MCQQCLDAVERYFPGLSDKDRHRLLWGATCFPFGPAEPHLREMYGAGVRTLDEALGYVDRKLAEEMEANDVTG